MSLLAKKESKVEIPVLVRIWQEDGVWNASAVHLPIVVFGNTFEESQRNMNDALLSHLDSLRKIGELEATIAMLRCVVRDPVPVIEMPVNESYMLFGAAMHGEHVMQLM